MLQALGQPSGAAFIMPKKVAETDPFKQIDDYIGSGPFIFVKNEWKPGEKTVYVKNPKVQAEGPSRHPGPGRQGREARPGRMGGDPRPAPATNALLRRGEIDMIEKRRSTTSLKMMERPIPGVEAGQPQTSGATTVHLPLQPALNKPFDNPKIRQAMLYAFNQEGLSSTA